MAVTDPERSSRAGTPPPPPFFIINVFEVGHMVETTIVSCVGTPLIK